VSWAAHLGVLDLRGSPFAFIASTPVLVIATLLAGGEYIADQLPFTPSRVSPGPLFCRLGSGILSGACLCAATDRSLLAGALLGGGGALLGAFTGYHVRGWLVQKRKIRDVLVGIPESLLALGLAAACVHCAVA